MHGKFIMYKIVQHYFYAATYLRAAVEWSSSSGLSFGEASSTGCAAAAAALGAFLASHDVE